LKTININEKLYPESLKHINKPPKQLYAIGNINLLSKYNISIVGTRHPTGYGIRNCKKFTKLLSQLDISIVSGMAIGIDTIAHITCLENNCDTIAVLPCGFDNIYPKSNNKLYKKIINSGGLVISEYEPHVKFDNTHFISRNRIIAGLSLCTVVIEAAYRSGTSITARYTFEQNKKVFCIPGNLENKYSVGTNKLIKKGANILTSIEDITNKYPFLNFKENVSQRTTIPKEYQNIYNFITEIEITIDELHQKLKIDIPTLTSQLTMLELEGYIIQLPGGGYIRNEQ